MAPILFDMSVLDICFSRLASAEKPLWGSMTPLLNVSCGPRIFHQTCVDVNVIRFSTYAGEMENTIVHIDTFGGEGMPACTPPAHRAAAVGKPRHLSDNSMTQALPSGKRLGQGRLRDREVGRRRD
ncbi:unnamed protein product, partial [Symbiodinium sp. CCMP2456]